MYIEQIDSAVEIAEDVAEAVEKVAEQVEKVAEDIVDDLPGSGKLKDAATFIEHLAEETAKDAHLVDELIDKVFTYSTTTFLRSCYCRSYSINLR